MELLGPNATPLSHAGHLCNVYGPVFTLPSFLVHRTVLFGVGGFFFFFLIDRRSFNRTVLLFETDEKGDRAGCFLFHRRCQ